MILRPAVKDPGRKQNSRDVFFARLPEYARLYAIPYAFSKQGLQKYGRKGNVHLGALRKINRLEKIKHRRVITVLFGEFTNIAAIKNGDPVEVSDGFSAAGGLLSETGCGEIDSAIVFQLLADGVSAARVEEILVKQSGFKALAAGAAGWKSVLVRKDPEAKFAREVFCYQILKHIGAYAAGLGGLDLILFIGEDRPQIKNLTFELMRQLDFMGIKKRGKAACGEKALLTADDSLIKAYFVEYVNSELRK